MSSIILYGPELTPFTEKVRRALALKGLSYALREPSGPEDNRRWSPKTGLLPVLEIDGERTADSTDILFRLDELFPEPPLLSRDPRIASQQRQIEDWADENLLRYFNRWSAARPDPDAPEEPRSSLRSLLAWVRAGGTWERPEVGLLRGLGDTLDSLIGFLGMRPFFYSDSISMADLGVYGMCVTMRFDFIPGSKKLLMARPVLIDFMARVEALTGGRRHDAENPAA